jgi:hypothetical protein
MISAIRLNKKPADFGKVRNIVKTIFGDSSGDSIKINENAIRK